ncbi:MAG: hypothetical protein WC451_03245 [Patescibacteria group bacterium]|jgi:hypothetical protein
MTILAEKNVRQNFRQRILTAAKAWSKKMESPLEHRDKMLQYWASGFFDKEKKQHTLNLTDRMMGIMVPYLTMADPKTMIESKVTSLKPFAYTTQLQMNQWIMDTKFSLNCLRPIVRNSMVGAGITLTGIATTETVEWKGQQLEIGQPFVEVIDDPDYVGDISGRSRKDFEFEGYYFRMPTEIAKEIYPKYADYIKPSGRLHGDHNPQDTSNEDQFVNCSLKDHTEFLNIWLPDERRIITLLPETDIGFLGSVEHKGLDDGPIDILGYKYSPKEPMPIPPVWFQLDMDTVINVIIEKMKAQAEREKSVLAYEEDAAEDAERVASTSDGGTVKVNNVDRMKDIQYGGVNDGLYKWVDYIESQFSTQGGNLYTMGGRSSQAETLGQEQMMLSNASRMVDDMVNMTYEHAGRVLRKVAWYRWNNPVIQVYVTKAISGLVEIQSLFSRTTRKGRFPADYILSVEPYSMQRFNPQVKQQQLMQFLSGWILPILPMAEQQGVKLDVNQATQQLARYIGLDIDGFWKTAMPTDMQLPQSDNLVPNGALQNGDRFGSSPSGKLANLAQYMNSPRAGQPSPPNKKKE